jgi:bifunctional DNA-binding transcriptional regulator/antitoxin component of YhaV-PrlF toxin-antitoxin module
LVQIATYVCVLHRAADEASPMGVKVAADGRLILPREARHAMGLSGDTKASLTVEGDVVRLAPLSHRVRRARELYRQAIAQPRSTEDFLRDRREEAARDEGGGTADDAGVGERP